MPTNESIIAVPATVEEPGQLRKFLLLLVEKLDIVLGYRGNDPYVTISDLQTAGSATRDELTILEQTVLDTLTTLLTENSELFIELLAAAAKAASESIDGLKSGDTITDADASQPLLTTPPTQVELQALQDQVGANAQEFNDLLTALRATGIIAT